MDKMIQKCPNCGQWVEVEKTGLVEGYLKGNNDAAELGANLLGSIGGIFGKKGKKIGENLGRLGGAAIGGTTAGIGEALFGDAFNFICPTCGYEWSTNDEADDQTEEYNRFLQEEERREEILELRSELMDRIWTASPNADAVRNYIQKVKDFMNNEVDNRFYPDLNDLLSLSYALIDENEIALKHIDASLSQIDDPHSKVLKGVYLTDMADKSPSPLKYIDALKCLLSIYDEGHEYNYFAANYIDSCIKYVTEQYVENFTKINPSQRRFICFRDDITSLGENILVLPLGLVPNNLYFPDGLPQKNVLYEIHPFKPNHYLNIDNYDFDLFKDKITEFKNILENLGAKQIEFSMEHGHTSEETTQNSNEIGMEADVKAYSGNGRFGKDKSNAQYEELKRSLEENVEFLPGSKPELIDPVKLVWYPHNEDWQTKVNSRLNGRINKFEVVFSSHSSYSLSESKTNELELEMKNLIARGKGTYNNHAEYSINRSENQVWRLKVEFYPLSVYSNKKENDTINLESKSLTESEQNYIETYKECCSDGNISSRERKLLDSICRQANISPERATELEIIAGGTKKKSFFKRLFSK